MANDGFITLRIPAPIPPGKMPPQEFTESYLLAIQQGKGEDVLGEMCRKQGYSWHRPTTYGVSIHRVGSCYAAPEHKTRQVSIEDAIKYIESRLSTGEKLGDIVIYKSIKYPRRYAYQPAAPGKKQEPYTPHTKPRQLTTQEMLGLLSFKYGTEELPGIKGEAKITAGAASEFVEALRRQQRTPVRPVPRALPRTPLGQAQQLGMIMPKTPISPPPSFPVTIKHEPVSSEIPVSPYDYDNYWQPMAAWPYRRSD